MGIKVPPTGTGDATPTIATDKIAGVDYQQVKLVDGTPGGSQGAIVDSAGHLKVALDAAVGASISNLPAVQPVSGLVGASVANQPTLVGASVPNFPTLIGASVPNFPAFPALQPVSGYLGASVPNFPALQPVSGYVGASVGLVGASIANLPATQAISGYVGASVPNFPAVQAISGLVGASVPNFPAVQAVSGYLGASAAGGYVGASVAGGYAGASIAGGLVGASVANTVGAAPMAATTGGASPLHFISGASVNNVNVKAAAGTVYSITAQNVNGFPRFLRLYDKSSTPSVGADVPRQTFIVPGSAAGGTLQFGPGMGILFAAGIGFGITGGSMGDTDKTATLLGDVVVNIGYS